MKSDGAASLGIIKCQESGNCWKPIKEEVLERWKRLLSWEDGPSKLDKRLGPDGWSKVPSGENK